MAPINPAPVAPPAARPPRHSLWGTLEANGYSLLDMGGDDTLVDSSRWEAGLAFESETCVSGDVLLVPCVEDILGEAGDCTTVVYQPYAIHVPLDRTGSARQSIDVDGRLARRLVAVQSRRMERELWRGDVAIANGLPNPFLSDATDLVSLNGGDATPLAYALSELQQAIAGCTASNPTFIHATIKTVNLWVSAGLVFREVSPSGEVFFYDAFGNHIVAGAGYDGGSPIVRGDEGDVVSGGTVDSSGDTAWAYATGTVFGAVGDIVRVPDTDSEAFDQATNSYVWGAYRMAGVTYDDCCTIGINVDLCTTCCSPTPEP